MKKEHLNKLLIKKFPKLETNYIDTVSWQEGGFTGSHVVYGDVLAPYLVECITSENIQETEEIFGFIEEILLFNEEYSTNVIVCSVIEHIMHLLMEHDYLQSRLGNISSSIFKNLKDSWNL